MSPAPSASGRRRFRAAAVLLLIQGGLLEGMPFLGRLVVVALDIDASAIAERVEAFTLPRLQDNLGALRITGAIGLLRGRLWGLALSAISCIVAFVVMVFLLPAGIVDGMLSGAALVLILTAWYGNVGITRPGHHRMTGLRP